MMWERITKFSMIERIPWETSIWISLPRQINIPLWLLHSSSFLVNPKWVRDITYEGVRRIQHNSNHSCCIPDDFIFDKNMHINVQTILILLELIYFNLLYSFQFVFTDKKVGMILFKKHIKCFMCLPTNMNIKESQGACST